MTVAFAPPTPVAHDHHARSVLTERYERAYHAVERQLGHRAPGRDIVRYGLPGGHPADARTVRRSLTVLERMLHPRTISSTPIVRASAPAVSPTTAPAAAAPSGGLAACIISHESGGNPEAVNGQYGGIGQWSPTAWQQDGGTRYASSPTGASYAEQVAVLDGEGAAGMVQQQGQWDGCS